MPAKWFCHPDINIELFPEDKTGYGLINTVNAAHRK
jgi:hypothetical protein